MQFELEQFRTMYLNETAALRKFQLPVWEEFPDLELYMDQLVLLLNRYLALQDGGKEQLVTASMVNNYVKMKIMPSPVKKRYGRPHLAYLLIICLLKDALGTAGIQKLFPTDMEEAEVREQYNAFVRNQRKAYDYVADSIDKVALPILQEDCTEERILDLLTQTCITASITKLAAERFLDETPRHAGGEPPQVS